jgi:hypothetical protein
VNCLFIHNSCSNIHSPHHYPATHAPHVPLQYSCMYSVHYCETTAKSCQEQGQAGANHSTLCHSVAFTDSNVQRKRNHFYDCPLGRGMTCTCTDSTSPLLHVAIQPARAALSSTAVIAVCKYKARQSTLTEVESRLEESMPCRNSTPLAKKQLRATTDR